MYKNKLILILACLFLVQPHVGATQDVRTIPVTSIIPVSPIESNPIPTTLHEYSILVFALSMYYMETRENLSMEQIRERLAGQPEVWKEKLAVAFDLDRTSFKKDGYTRYYPFSVRGRDFIIRFFRLKEKDKLPLCDVLHEGTFPDSELAFQIIPGINALLEGKDIKKILPDKLPQPTMYP